MIRSTSLRLCLLPLMLIALGSTALAKKTTGTAPAPVPPRWTLDFDDPVQWQRVTPLGQLVVSTMSGLHGVDPDGRIGWRHPELRGLAAERFEMLPGTPLAVIAEEGAEPRVVVLDSMDGRVVFDSETAGVVNVLDQFVLPRIAGLLVLGFTPGEPKTKMFLFDIATGEHRWTNDKLIETATKSKLAGLLTAVVQATTGDSGIRSMPFETGGAAFLLASGAGVHKIDARTGEFLWTVKEIYTGDEVRFHTTTERPGVVFAGSQIRIESSYEATQEHSVWAALRIDDGAKLWSEPVKLDGLLNEPIFVEQGMIVSPRTAAKGAIKLIDYDDGSSKWGPKGKGIKLEGGIVGHDFSAAGIVLTTGYDSAWTNKGTQYYLNVLDPQAGQLRFKKPTKLQGRILRTEVLPKGVLYITTHEINVFDPQTGQPLHARSIESKNGLVTAVDGDLLYAFSDKDQSLWVVDGSDSSMKRLSRDKVALEGDESPLALEINDDGILLISSQNLAAFGRDGSLRFHAYHPAPRYHGVVRALLWAQAVRAGMGAAASTVTGAGFAGVAQEQDPDSVGHTISSGLSEGYGMMADNYVDVSKSYADAARARFKASAVAPDFVFMMVRQQTGYGLAKVSKTDGKILAMIDMKKDKTPSYQVDGVSNRIYYRRAPNEIVAYGF